MMRSSVVACLALAGLVFTAACRLAPTESPVTCTIVGCDGFPEAYRTLLPTDSGQLLRFTDGAHELALRTTTSYVSAPRLAGTYTSTASMGCGDPAPCSARAQWTATTVDSTGHPAFGFTYRLRYGNVPAGPNATSPSESVSRGEFECFPAGLSGTFHFAPEEFARADQDVVRVATDQPLGPRHFDRLFVLTADTFRTYSGIWRVYLAVDGGVVGFNSRVTHRLYWRL